MVNNADRDVTNDNEVLSAEYPLPADMPETGEIETNLQGVSDRARGQAKAGTPDQIASGEDTRGGDVDSNRYQAKVVGDEAVGGLAPTPGQNVTQELQEAAGIQSAEKEPVQTTDKLNRRDDSRWELDPKSSEDYDRRRNR